MFQARARPEMISFLPTRPGSLEKSPFICRPGPARRKNHLSIAGPENPGEEMCITNKNGCKNLGLKTLLTKNIAKKLIMLLKIVISFINIGIIRLVTQGEKWIRQSKDEEHHDSAAT